MLPEPPLKNLDRFRVLAEEHGQKVLRHFNWGAEYEWEGEVCYSEPRWETHLVKEAKQADGRIFAQVLLLDDQALERGWPEQWEHLIKLNELGFEALLEREGYGTSS